MASNISAAPVSSELFTKEKDHEKYNMDSDSAGIETAPAIYNQEEESKSGGSEEINYHTLEWWYAFPIPVPQLEESSS